MRTFTSRQAARSFGEALDAAQHGPVAITKNGRKRAVLISVAEFGEFELLKLANTSERLILALGEARQAADEDDVDKADRIIRKMPRLFRRG